MGGHGGHRLGCEGAGPGGVERTPIWGVPLSGALLAAVGCMGMPRGCWGVAPHGVTCPSCPPPQALAGVAHAPRWDPCFTIHMPGGGGGAGAARSGGLSRQSGTPSAAACGCPGAAVPGGAPTELAPALSPTLSPLVLRCPVGLVSPGSAAMLSPRETPRPSRSHGATTVAVAMAEAGVCGQQ